MKEDIAPHAASAADDYDGHDDALVDGAGIVIGVTLGLAFFAAIAIVISW